MSGEMEEIRKKLDEFEEKMTHTRSGEKPEKERRDSWKIHARSPNQGLLRKQQRNKRGVIDVPLKRKKKEEKKEEKKPAEKKPEEKK